jgi:hypothetical protein
VAALFPYERRINTRACLALLQSGDLDEIQTIEINAIEFRCRFIQESFQFQVNELGETLAHF